MLSLEELRGLAEAGELHTVLLGFVDTQGRLQGKRCSVGYFLDSVVGHGSGACNYLLAVNVEMEPQSGYEVAGWDKGYGDYVLRPDLSTLRLAGWRERTAICLADAAWPDQRPVAVSPRQILRHQVDRLAERGWTAMAATELEFIVHRESYAEAWNAGYRGLSSINRFNVDYSLMGLAEADPFIDRVCRAVERSGLPLETAKGEANFGQHEINLRYDEALAAADAHMVFKQIVKETALQMGVSATFMAKWNEREGNSCHVHMSLRDRDGAPVFHADPQLFERFLAGQLAVMRDLTLLFAPNVNSYKRFTSRSFAPTAIAWGRDNRSCAIRVVGSGAALRMEHRLGGGDVNPYLVLAATIAAGLHGIDNELDLPPAEEHNAYAAAHARVPSTLADAIGLFSASAVARSALSDTVVDHLTRAAEIERDEFAASVTDWERFRGYERL